MPQQPKVSHLTGPFAGIKEGDVLQIIYHEAQAALMKVTKVKLHSLEGLDGEIKCRVTLATANELRFYATLSPVRERVLRNVRLIKVLDIQTTP